jgi:hypothetical protein
MIFFPLSLVVVVEHGAGEETSPIVMESCAASFGSDLCVGELTLSFLGTDPGPLDLLFFSFRGGDLGSVLFEIEVIPLHTFPIESPPHDFSSYMRERKFN